MILESTMVLIVSLCLTFGHPGLYLDIPWKLPMQCLQTLRDATSEADSEIVQIGNHTTIKAAMELTRNGY